MSDTPERIWISDAIVDGVTGRLGTWIDRAEPQRAGYVRAEPGSVVLTAEEAETVREAITQAERVLNDWLTTYADDLCDAKDVAAARERIGEFGTIAYIAEAQSRAGTAFALLTSKVKP